MTPIAAASRGKRLQVKDSTHRVRKHGFAANHRVSGPIHAMKLLLGRLTYVATSVYKSIQPRRSISSTA